MLKFIVLEFIKIYTKQLAANKKEQKKYSGYFIGFFTVIGLILLIIADYVFIYNDVQYLPYIAVLLKISTSLFLAAILIKVFSMWFSWKAQREEEIPLNLSMILSESLPLLVSLLPIGVVAYILWAKVHVKVSGKSVRVRNLLKDLF